MPDQFTDRNGLIVARDTENVVGSWWLSTNNRLGIHAATRDFQKVLEKKRQEGIQFLDEEDGKQKKVPFHMAGMYRVFQDFGASGFYFYEEDDFKRNFKKGENPVLDVEIPEEPDELAYQRHKYVFVRRKDDITVGRVIVAPGGLRFLDITDPDLTKLIDDGTLGARIGIPSSNHTLGVTELFNSIHPLSSFSLLDLEDYVSEKFYLLPQNVLPRMAEPIAQAKPEEEEQITEGTFETERVEET